MLDRLWGKVSVEPLTKGELEQVSHRQFEDQRYWSVECRNSVQGRDVSYTDSPQLNSAVE